MINDAAVSALFETARRAMQRAYAPYSCFPVGAAALGLDGAIHAGCNVENAAFPVGVCAEAGALAAMAVAGETRLAAILVVGGGAELCTPCGACRQRIREFGDDTTPVLVAGPEGIRRRFTLGELLPESFGPENVAVVPAPG